MTLTAYQTIQALRQQGIYLTTELEAKGMEPLTRPHTVIPKGEQYGVMIGPWQGLLCPEWGDDLEHTDYYVVEHATCYRGVAGRSLEEREMKKGTKCFILPEEVYTLVLTKGYTQDDLLLRILTKEGVKQ